MNKLLKYHDRLDYLKTEGTLAELLDFLGMQYFDGSRKKGNEHRDVYEFIKEGTMAIEVILTESKVRIWSRLSAWDNIQQKILFGTSCLISILN